MYFRRMVLATTVPACSSPRAATQRIMLWASVASTAQAALALISPDGQRESGTRPASAEGRRAGAGDPQECRGLVRQEDTFDLVAGFEFLIGSLIHVYQVTGIVTRSANDHH